MPIPLYAATVETYAQLLGGVAGLLDKAEAWCAETGKPPADVIQARLAPDMFPFSYQVKSTVAHSIGAIEGVRRGVFKPDLAPPPETFAELKAGVAGAIAALGAVAPEEVESFVGRDMRFEFGERRIEFTAENFLLSFSLPNFYFHATTTYDILRWKGLAIGKKDYTGRLRIKPR
jgi:hypothetical protein